MSVTTEYRLRGGLGVRPWLLNKITGWDSRTVPPLYVLKADRDENRSLEFSPGRLCLLACVATHGYAQVRRPTKHGLFRSLRVMGSAFVAEKRLRRPFWTPQYFILEG